jgi:hypothetical protein
LSSGGITDEEDDLPENATGCARTEGYVKLDRRVKAKYLARVRRDIPGKDNKINVKLGGAAGGLMSSARATRINYRRLTTAVESTQSDILKLNQLKSR